MTRTTSNRGLEIGPASTQPGEPWREPVRGGHPDPSLLSLSGWEQLEHLLDGRTPAPPLSRLTGMRLEAFAAGTATFVMPLTEWLCGPRGTIAIGPLCIPADAAMACAVMTGLPAHTLFTTSELSLRLLAPARPGGVIRARARVVEARPPVVLAEVELRTDDQTLIAHGSSLCITLAPTSTSASAPTPSHPPASPAADGHGSGASPDPWRRGARGACLDEAVWHGMSGMDILTGRISGRLAASPIEFLTGLAPIAGSIDEATFVLQASPWFCAPPPGRLQGGVVALLADAALDAAAQTAASPGVSFTPLDLKCNYLRPLASDGREARAHARLIHSGRRIGVTRADVLDADGRPVAAATGSGLFTAASRTGASNR